MNISNSMNVCIAERGRQSTGADVLRVANETIINYEK